MLEQLDNKRLIFVTGKGGVGKSTGTAALGDALCRMGRNVLLVETDAYSAMSEILGARGKDGQPIDVRDGLTAINLKSSECLVNTLTRYLPSERVVRAVTQNRVTESFFKSAPSVNEFVLLDQILEFLDDPKLKYDHIVVDLPASGHAVTFLSVPKTLNDMMRGVGPIAKRATEVHRWIQDSRQTAIVAVCLPEEMPVNETIELAGNLEDALGRGLDMTLVNMVHPRPFPSRFDAAFEEMSETLGTDENPAGVLTGDEHSNLERVVAGNDLALNWFKRDRRYLDILHERLGADVEVIELPMVYEIEEADIVDRLAGYMAGEDLEEDLAS